MRVRVTLTPTPTPTPTLPLPLSLPLPLTLTLTLTLPWQLGFLLGPPTGGLLYQLGGFRCPFLVTAALATPNQG